MLVTAHHQLNFRVYGLQITVHCTQIYKLSVIALYVQLMFSGYIARLSFTRPYLFTEKHST